MVLIAKTKKEKENKTAIIKLRVTPSFKEEIEGKAEKLNVTVSSYVVNKLKN